MVITYEEDGHVSDEDAHSIDYDVLLADMQKRVAAENDARRDAGYEAIRLVGWASKPYAAARQGGAGYAASARLHQLTAGNRYEDFDARLDKMAAYGLGALVAGGVAAKTGLLAKLLALLVAFKKAIILGVLAVAGVAGKVLFGRKGQPA